MRKQCAKCPWRKDVDPTEIPGEYCEVKHRGLKKTIAKPANVADLLFKELQMMACHETPPGREKPCVGWLVHQFGPGNNIGLRMAVFEGRVDMDVEPVGEQHERFEDTIPKGKPRDEQSHSPSPRSRVRRGR